MSRPHKCPVCEGSGVLNSYLNQECHACGGKGIVWEPELYERWPCRSRWKHCSDATWRWTYKGPDGKYAEVPNVPLGWSPWLSKYDTIPTEGSKGPYRLSRVTRTIKTLIEKP